MSLKCESFADENFKLKGGCKNKVLDIHTVYWLCTQATGHLQTGVTKSGLSRLTNSALVYEPKCGGGLRCLSQWVQLCTWRSNSIFHLCLQIFRSILFFVNYCIFVTLEALKRTETVVYISGHCFIQRGGPPDRWMALLTCSYDVERGRVFTVCTVHCILHLTPVIGTPQAHTRLCCLGLLATL
jgi:hypothetical protein